MISPKNKRVQVTLPEETYELLKSLSIRYNKSSSEIVKWALNILGAKKKHNLTIMLRENQVEESPKSEEIREDINITEMFKDR